MINNHFYLFQSDLDKELQPQVDFNEILKIDDDHHHHFLFLSVIFVSKIKFNQRISMSFFIDTIHPILFNREKK